MSKKIRCGMFFDDTNPLQDAHAVDVYEDDHGIVVDIDVDKHIRIEPQSFPKLIALMAKTMDGMVEF